MIRIIHLSDFHLKNENLENSQKNLITALINDIEQYVNKDTVVIFSGDFVDKGGLAFKDPDLKFYYFEEHVIDPILKKFPELKGKFLFAPGNHDLERNKINSFKDKPMRDSFVSSPDLVDEFLPSIRKDKGENIVGMNSYKTFEKDFFVKHLDPSNYDITAFESSFIIENGDESVGVTALNSAWLCYEDDNLGKLFIGRNQIENSLDFISDTTLKIAILHHPFEFLNKKDFKKIKPLLYSNYEMLFLGHTHRLESQKVDDLDGNLFLSIGKSINGIQSEEINYTNGYSVIDYEKNERITVYHRKYIDNHKTFVVNSDIGNDEGVKSFEIPKEGEQKIIQEVSRIIDNIKEENFPKLNEDLILNISQSNKGKLSEIYVEPVIGNLPENNLDNNDNFQFYSTQDLVNSIESQIIFGAKETGKTILLDKLLIDLTDNFHKTRRLPILLKFNEIGNNSVKQIVKQYISKSSKETTELINSVNIDLLIDDLDFSSQFKYQINELKNFISEYPDTRVIATVNNTEDEIVPVKLISAFSEIKDDFETYYIHLFKSKQIKGLIANWVTTSDIDLHENIEKLLKGFREIGLPKTPLAVTIFLWIINKQQNRPINNAVLVEMFVENLLEKGNIQNIYFDTFDFGDKQRLLAFLAKFMLDKDNSNLGYRVKEYELEQEIESYLENKIDINPSRVLEYLIERGILVKCNGNSIRFKTAFFFSYFLAKYIGYSKKFKKKVLNGKNYLNYINELDFYTGLNREDEEVFDFLNKEVEEVYGYINSKVKDEYYELDRVLETKETISSRIDLSKAKTKPTEQEIEQAYDSQIATVPSRKNIEAKINLEDQPTEEIEAIRFSKLLKLTAIVFKNSSDIDHKKRIDAYGNILISSISYMMMYRDSILYFKENHKEEVAKLIPKEMDFGFFMKILPILHQVTMYNWLGSYKSAPIIRKKIIADQTTEDISEFEKFLSIYIYADIRGKNYPDYIKSLFKSTKKKYILDSSFIKNMSYYYLRSKTTESDKDYAGLLADIKTKLGESSKRNKGEFIKHLKEEKNKKETED
ncbi:metallophosphoesterase [Christiangramia echinicola]|uniref:STAND family AAA ATPase n=1 Tax=Christiangramia echinicola TaxID=279359 RepID=UPI0003F89BA6|nr:metallophosphoesterase [Christiangramia echinicola]